jgi:hypothetical protein
MTRRRLAFGLVPLAVAAVPVALAWPSAAAVVPAATRVVTSISALQSALGSAAPGDVIQLADGSYSTSSTISISKSGTVSAPITVQAQHAGGATITGSGGFSIGASYVAVSGFRLTGSRTLSIPVGATHVQLTRNVFQLAGSVQYWVTVGGDDAQIDHNTFQHKSTIGNFIEVVGPGSSAMAQRTWIHHNYFLDHSYGGGNGGESIRVGLSGRQHSSAHALVEENLFEKCDGDLEVISVKSTDDVIRYNTLRDSKGTITLRHGWNNLVEGNYLIGNSTGIRMFGNNHVVINNVIESSTGQALEIGGGEVRDDTTSGTNHEAVDHAVVAFNTFVGDRSSPIQMGDGGKAFQPTGVTVADNIVSGSGSALSLKGGSSLHYQGNMLGGLSGGSMPGSGYTTANPKLVLDAGGVYRLSAGSPAIDAATGTFTQVTLDMDGQTRSGTKDVGADEFGAPGAPREPLTTADVGPGAGGSSTPPPTTTRYEAETATNGTAANRPMDIAVNGVVVSAGMAFAPTANWDTWTTATLTLPLTEGANTIRATATTANGGPNVDYIEI